MCTIVGKTWSLHLEKVVKVDREENLRMISESVAFLVGEGKRVIYDAEHFFDGFVDDPAYALSCVRAAAEAGADTVTCCDTNGGTLPHQIGLAVADVVAALAPAGGRVGPKIGIHCHDDSGCGVACTLAAVERGAVHVQGTMNGYGERCGNANLVTIIPNLQLKLGYECVTEEQLASLTQAAHFFDEMLNFTPDPDQPYVGRNAFAHKGGMHVAGVSVDPATFEHIDPDVVGNRRELLISELSGKGTVHARARDAGISLGDGEAGTAGRAGQGARAPRLPLRGGGRVVRAAAAQGDRGVRAAVPARVLARDRREARRRPGRDRGDDQDLASTASATCGPPRATAR